MTAPIGHAAVGLCAFVALSCAPPAYVLGEGSTSSGSSLSLSEGSSGSSTTGDDSTSSTTGDAESSDSGPPPGCGGADNPCPAKIDLLFVIDNSGTMGDEQLNLARNFGALIEELGQLTDVAGAPIAADVNIMVTTTDFGNPSCDDEFKPPDYTAAAGGPVATACTDRISRFTGRGLMPEVIEEACFEVCDPDAVAAPLDQFIHIGPDGHNVVGGTPAQALACIGPQGIDGCGFESPLEVMSQALNPAACWNDPSACDEYDQPFLRDDAILAIAIITDEADCSIRDYSIMTDPTFMETDPMDGTRDPSSALCWNAGVVCSDYDAASGEYSGCVAADKGSDGNVGVSESNAVLHPISRYTAVLEAYLAEGREVMMLGVLGVPAVTEHAQAPPHEPVAGGIDELVYREWADPEYPGGDILPDDWADGQRAVDKQFEFGIGPGCTSVSNSHTGQAIPPVRIRQTCESLNEPDNLETAVDESRIRCCIESICSDDYTPALRCLTGLIRTAIVPAG